MLYAALAPAIKRKIAFEYGIPDSHFASWMHALSYVRNVCAHHKRLWNRQLQIKPQFPSRNLAWGHDVPDNGHLYCIVVGAATHAQDRVATMSMA